MQDVKKWILAALILIAFGSGAMLTTVTSPPTAVAQGPRPPAEVWRHHDGHWSYWHEGDKRWYYTDGVHWYYHNGTSWVLYTFDKLFGDIFHHGGYRTPGPEVKMVLPMHQIHR